MTEAVTNTNYQSSYNLSQVQQEQVGQVTAQLQDTLLLATHGQRTKTSNQQSGTLGLPTLPAPSVTDTVDTSSIEAQVEAQYAVLMEELEADLGTELFDAGVKNAEARARNAKKRDDLLASVNGDAERFLAALPNLKLEPENASLNTLWDTVQLAAQMQVVSSMIQTVGTNNNPTTPPIEVSTLIRGAEEIAGPLKRGVQAMSSQLGGGQRYDQYLTTLMNALFQALKVLQDVQVANASQDGKFSEALRAEAKKALEAAQKAESNRKEMAAAEAQQKEKSKLNSILALVGAIVLTVIICAVTILFPPAGAAAPAAVAGVVAAQAAVTTTTFTAANAVALTLAAASIALAVADYATEGSVSQKMQAGLASLAESCGGPLGAGAIVFLTTILAAIILKGAAVQVGKTMMPALSSTTAQGIKTLYYGLAIQVLMMTGSVSSIASGIAKATAGGDPTKEASINAALQMIFLILMLILMFASGRPSSGTKEVALSVEKGLDAADDVGSVALSVSKSGASQAGAVAAKGALASQEASVAMSVSKAGGAAAKEADIAMSVEDAAQVAFDKRWRVIQNMENAGMVLGTLMQAGAAINQGILQIEHGQLTIRIGEYQEAKGNMEALQTIINAVIDRLKMTRDDFAQGSDLVLSDMENIFTLISSILSTQQRGVQKLFS